LLLQKQEETGPLLRKLKHVHEFCNEHRVCVVDPQKCQELYEQRSRANESVVLKSDESAWD